MLRVTMAKESETRPPNKKKKSEYDSERRVKCYYCDTEMASRKLSEHTKKYCKKADGRKPREKVSSGQSLLSTERVVKLLREIEPRFAGYDETNLAQGKRDRCLQEVFLCDNQIAIHKLPLDEYEKEWVKGHHFAAKLTIDLGSIVFRLLTS